MLFPFSLRIAEKNEKTLPAPEGDQGKPLP